MEEKCSYEKKILRDVSKQKDNTYWVRRMPSSGTLCLVALVRTDIFGEPSACIIRVIRIRELGRILALTNKPKYAAKIVHYTIVFLRSLLWLLVIANYVPR
jgi:hypothetical protein